nr:hypothetical protein [Tanacetum cinerariifolium]
LAEYINTLSWNRPAFYNYDDDDDEDYTIAITPVLSTEEPVDSLIMEDEHLDTIPTTESDKVIKSSVEDLVLILSESEGIPDNMCDVPFRDSSPPAKVRYWKIPICYDNDEDYTIAITPKEPDNSLNISKKIYSNPLFDEEIISIKIDLHHFNAESDLIESLLNHYSSIISSSLKIDSLLDEFAGKLILLKSIPLGINETDSDPEEEIRLIKKLLYDNSSPHPSEEFISENSDVAIKSFSPSPIPVEDSDSVMMCLLVLQLS